MLISIYRAGTFVAVVEYGVEKKVSMFSNVAAIMSVICVNFYL